MKTAIALPSSSPPRSNQDLVGRDLAEYGVARLRDLMFDAVLSLWRRRKSEGWTQKIVAEKMGRDPGWVSRNLRAPGNWTLRTGGEFIQGLDGEAEIKIFALEDKSDTPSNYDAYEGYLPSAPDKMSRLQQAVIISIDGKGPVGNILINNPMFITAINGGRP